MQPLQGNKKMNAKRYGEGPRNADTITAVITLIAALPKKTRPSKKKNANAKLHELEGSLESSASTGFVESLTRMVSTPLCTLSSTCSSEKPWPGSVACSL